MKRRIVSVVTLITFLTSFILSLNGGIANAADSDVAVISPDNMLDVSVVDKDGNLISGINMTLVDSSGTEVANWTNGGVSVSSIEGSYIKGKSNSGGYPVYVWKYLEEASKLVENNPVKEIIKPLGDGGISQILCREGDRPSGSYTYSGDTSNDCVIKYFGKYDTALTVLGGKVVTVIDESYTKGSVHLGDTVWQLSGNHGMNTFDIAAGDYRFESSKTTTVSNETTEYIKMRIKLTELSQSFNEDGTYKHPTLGDVAFPAQDPDVTAVLAFCSGSVITVPKPDSDGYVEIYVEKTERKAILDTSFSSSSTVGGGVALTQVMYDRKECTFKGKNLPSTGTLMFYVPAGNYTVKMSNVPAAYTPKQPVDVTVTDSSEIQKLSIKLDDVHEHVYGTEYKKDATNHWNECACGEKGNVAVHTPGPEATETSPQVCTVCGYEIAPVKQHEHVYKTEYKSDATNHWNECACGEKGNVAAHTPGPEATETSPQVCTVCGYEIAPVKQHEHVYGTEYKSDATNHWNECACGEKGNVAAHAYIWVIDKEATYTQEGFKHEVCSVCGYKKSEVAIPVIAAPQTGERSNVVLFYVLAAAAVAVMTGVVVYGKRRIHKNM